MEPLKRQSDLNSEKNTGRRSFIWKMGAAMTAGVLALFHFLILASYSQVGPVEENQPYSAYLDFIIPMNHCLMMVTLI